MPAFAFNAPGTVLESSMERAGRCSCFGGATPYCCFPYGLAPLSFLFCAPRLSAGIEGLWAVIRWPTAAVREDEGTKTNLRAVSSTHSEASGFTDLLLTENANDSAENVKPSLVRHEPREGTRPRRGNVDFDTCR